jgi:hypothetical protein
VLVRKLRRKNHWASAAQIADILNQVFLYDSRPYSLFQVGSEAELDKVALALNAGRDSLSEECNFVYFKAEEVQTAGIPLSQTPGATPCLLANRLHFDTDATEAQLLSLLSLAKASGRGVTRRTKGAMNTVLTQASAEQCLAAVSNSPECKAADCVATPSAS